MVMSWSHLAVGVPSIGGDGLENDTIVYVGEGRGGANANDAFFDYLEQEGWILMKILNVKAPPKGYEQLYLLKKKKQKK
eukprot:CAMPEP_0116857480 /NCGR_PEP_ID=MMETSP0418-20121206/20572_1 /TAXON_ID=1158023 /ORGANISM="Astrosyne radiata, Strain 13vi08-1A" /LENGTH=78 /DNA_ID=CAMNT_0004491159 /DNA_START=114 /DNA_END=350 /DNA_ORIENTATION=+